jgi:hypothetical protein
MAKRMWRRDCSGSAAARSRSIPVAKGRTGVGYAANVWGQRAIRTASKACIACLRCCRCATLLLGSSSGRGTGCGGTSGREEAGSGVPGWTRAAAGDVAAGGFCGVGGGAASADRSGTAAPLCVVTGGSGGAVEVAVASAGGGCTGACGSGGGGGCA